MAIAPALLEFEGAEYAFETRVRAMVAFSSIFSDGWSDPLPNELLEMLEPHLRLALELADAAVDDGDIAGCHHALIVLFQAMGMRVLPYAKPVLASMREIVATPLQVGSYMEFSGESLDLSSLEKIESSSGAKQYIEKSAIRRIRNALEIMSTLLAIRHESLAEDAHLALELIIRQMRSELYIPAMDLQLWNLLAEVISFPGMSPEIIAIPITLFLEIDHPHRSGDSLQGLFGCLCWAIQHSPAPEQNEQLAIVTRLVEVFFRGAKEIHTVLNRDQPADEIDEEGDTLHVLVTNVSFFDGILECLLVRYPDEAVPYVTSVVVPEVTNWMMIPAMRLVSISVLASYFAQTGDLGQLQSFAGFVNWMLETPGEPDMKLGIFRVFHRFFQNHALPPGVFQDFFALLCNYLGGPEALEEPFGATADEALVSLTWLLKTNFTPPVDDDEMMGTWFGFLPLIVQQEEWDAVGTLLADWMDHRDLSLWSEADFERCMPWFVDGIMLAVTSAQTTARLLQWFHRIRQFCSEIQPNPVDTVLEELATQFEARKSSIERLIATAGDQPLDEPPIIPPPNPPF
jgi:hypothetical protein